MIDKVVVEKMETNKVMKLMSLFKNTKYDAYIDSAEGRTYLRLKEKRDVRKELAIPKIKVQ